MWKQKQKIVSDQKNKIIQLVHSWNINIILSEYTFLKMFIPYLIKKIPIKKIPILDKLIFFKFLMLIFNVSNIRWTVSFLNNFSRIKSHEIYYTFILYNINSMYHWNRFFETTSNQYLMFTFHLAHWNTWTFTEYYVW